MSNVDPYLAVADELGRLGRRLDGLGAHLLALRASADRSESRTAPESPRTSHQGDARQGGEVAPLRAPIRPGASLSAADQPTVPRPSKHWARPDQSGGSHLDVLPSPAVREQFPGAQQVPGVQPGPATEPHAGAQPFSGAPGTAGKQYLRGPAEDAWWRQQADEPGQAPDLPRRGFSALSGARLLAWVGGAVTLLGVVMLLVLAASRGWFAPPARVGAGAVLGIALVAIAVWLHRRRSARTGALALAATGFATLYLVVAAATSLYDYLDPTPALGVALLIGAAALGLADRWRSQLLGAGAVVGATVLAPVVTWGWVSVALALALQLAALPIVLRRRWPVLMLVAAVGPVLAGSALAVESSVLDSEIGPTTVAVVLGVLAVALATAVPAAALLPTRPVAAIVAVAPVAVHFTGVTLGGWGGGALILVAALALGAVAVLPGMDRLIRLVAGIAAVVALFQATLVAMDGASAAAVVIGQAIVAAGVAARLRARFPLFVAMVYGAIGTLAAFAEDARPPIGYPYPGAAARLPEALLIAGGLAALVLVLAVALLVAGGRVGLIRPDAASARLWVPIGLAGLYGEATLVVTLALLVSADRTAFTAGHALVTVSWAVVALVLLARGISRPALRITGMVLVSAAVAKLVLFDLVALDGIARVAAFLGAGLVLLAAGTRYARLVAEAEEAAPARGDAAPAGAVPPPAPS